MIARGRKRVRFINAATDARLFLTPPPSVGFYLYDIEIVGFDGKILATYSKYLRVEESFWNVRLGLSRHQVRAGQRVLSRVENLGTETVYFGEDFGIERNEGGDWIDVPNPTQRWWARWLGGAAAGFSGRCSALYLPGNFPVGSYRIVKEVGPYPWPQEGQSYYLTAPFVVVG